MSYVRIVAGRMMKSKRYEFHREQAVVWALYFDRKASAWHVEKAGEGAEPHQFTINAFEATDDGKRLGAMLDAVVQTAADDA
jgi:hypothetical protein